jgi:hypothetical protein
MENVERITTYLKVPIDSTSLLFDELPTGELKCRLCSKMLKRVVKFKRKSKPQHLVTQMHAASTSSLEIQAGGGGQQGQGAGSVPTSHPATLSLAAHFLAAELESDSEGPESDAEMQDVFETMDDLSDGMFDHEGGEITFSAGTDDMLALERRNQLNRELDFVLELEGQDTPFATVAGDGDDLSISRSMAALDIFGEPSSEPLVCRRVH